MGALPLHVASSHHRRADCWLLRLLQVGRLAVVSSKEDLQAAEAAAKQPGFFVMDATDWKVCVCDTQERCNCTKRPLITWRGPCPSTN
jgi:hypothetical protein